MKRRTFRRSDLIKYEENRLLLDEYYGGKNFEWHLIPVVNNRAIEVVCFISH